MSTKSFKTLKKTIKAKIKRLIKTPYENSFGELETAPKDILFYSFENGIVLSATTIQIDGNYSVNQSWAEFYFSEKEFSKGFDHKSKVEIFSTDYPDVDFSVEDLIYIYFSGSTGYDDLNLCICDLFFKDNMKNHLKYQNLKISYGEINKDGEWYYYEYPLPEEYTYEPGRYFWNIYCQVNDELIQQGYEIIDSGSDNDSAWGSVIPKESS